MNVVPRDLGSAAFVRQTWGNLLIPKGINAGTRPSTEFDLLKIAELSEEGM